MYVNIQYVYLCVYIHVNVRLSTYGSFSYIGRCVHVNVCMYVCTYVCSVYICMFCVCTYIRAYVCTYLCTLRNLVKGCYVEVSTIQMLFHMHSSLSGPTKTVHCREISGIRAVCCKRFLCMFAPYLVL